MKFFVAQTSITRFFSSIFEKLNIFANYKPIILIFVMNLPLVFIYKFYKKETQIKPPGESREQYLGVVRQGTLKFKFNVRNHRNF